MLHVLFVIFQFFFGLAIIAIGVSIYKSRHDDSGNRRDPEENIRHDEDMGWW
jgi:hypothetical protein